MLSALNFQSKYTWLAPEEFKEIAIQMNRGKVAYIYLNPSILKKDNYETIRFTTLIN